MDYWSQSTLRLPEKGRVGSASIRTMKTCRRVICLILTNPVNAQERETFPSSLLRQLLEMHPFLVALGTKLVTNAGFSRE